MSRSIIVNEIKKRYRQLNRKYYPDVSKKLNRERKFKQINSLRSSQRS
ncbi:DnaJ domain-containing protein [Coxiella endosymbiont of Dermacentor marginatus]